MQTATPPTLASMQDIQTPPDIGNWPLAYGYWLVLFIAIALIALICFGLIKRHKQRAIKRAAINELSQLKLDDRQFASHVNALLKRCAMSHGTREQFAHLDGEPWFTWLNSQTAVPDTTLTSLLAKRYQPMPLSQDEAQQLQDAAKRWLQQALPLKALKGDTPC
ncbi:DUF4381 domain-containing protein [Shewanella colwelliana]|uniref:DUF4381 domain-containing protein n=1 Tax=Shewanella colwelliana TaxID=23 RepID=UPI0022AF7517|nr:DUF4381 domain-containing protein [Shewanella colwelliana]MCZ4338757.1 DUF4381 domain-containing protein [Shewanella colwelliana]